jgi:hypothetical protein
MTPGTRLLQIAPLFFNERFIASVVHPTIADLQSELEAADGRSRRLRALGRGYAAFWMLIFVAPFASWSDHQSGASTARLVVGAAGVSVLMLVTFGAWTTLIIAAAGGLVAFLIHAWHERHPSEIALLPERRWRSPQINFSSTDVGGNAGGLIFVVGSVLIVSLGLPSVFWFLVTAALAAGFVAWGLAVWHRRTQDGNCGRERVARASGYGTDSCRQTRQRDAR